MMTKTPSGDQVQILNGASQHKLGAVATAPRHLWMAISKQVLLALLRWARARPWRTAWVLEFDAGAPLPAIPRFGACPEPAQRSQDRTSRSGSPNSAATRATDRPPRIAAAASSLNASGKDRRRLPLLLISTSLAVQPIRGVRESGAGPRGSPSALRTCPTPKT
jgi:hypothetical protein